MKPILFFFITIGLGASHVQCMEGPADHENFIDEDRATEGARAGTRADLQPPTALLSQGARQVDTTTSAPKTVVPAGSPDAGAKVDQSFFGSLGTGIAKGFTSLGWHETAGDVHTFFGNHDAAIDSYSKAADVHEQAGNIKQESRLRDKVADTLSKIQEIRTEQGSRLEDKAVDALSKIQEIRSARSAQEKMSSVVASVLQDPTSKISLLKTITIASNYRIILNNYLVALADPTLVQTTRALVQQELSNICETNIQTLQTISDAQKSTTQASLIRALQDVQTRIKSGAGLPTQMTQNDLAQY
ncbi:hypothetical protein EBR77_03665, partial [bacterium]|nr:hypothetical protein [bacterium]